MWLPKDKSDRCSQRNRESPKLPGKGGRPRDRTSNKASWTSASICQISPETVCGYRQEAARQNLQQWIPTRHLKVVQRTEKKKRGNCPTGGEHGPLRPLTRCFLYIWVCVTHNQDKQQRSKGGLDPPWPRLSHGGWGICDTCWTYRGRPVIMTPSNAQEDCRGVSTSSGWPLTSLHGPILVTQELGWQLAHGKTSWAQVLGQMHEN